MRHRLYNYHAYLTISHRRRGEHRLVITESEVTNCFSTNFQMFTNNNQLIINFTKIHFEFITVYKKQETVNLDQSESRKLGNPEIYTNLQYITIIIDGGLR